MSGSADERKPDELHELLWDYAAGEKDRHGNPVGASKPVTLEALQAALSALPQDEATQRLGVKDQVDVHAFRDCLSWMTVKRARSVAARLCISSARTRA